MWAASLAYCIKSGWKTGLGTTNGTNESQSWDRSPPVVRQQHLTHPVTMKSCGHWNLYAQVQGGISFLWERQRLNVRIVKDLIADYVDPVRFYPLVGPAQQHHAHYKCTVYFSEQTYVGWPVPHKLVDEDAVEVIYIDHNHLHMAGDVDGGVRSNYQAID